MKSLLLILALFIGSFSYSQSNKTTTKLSFDEWINTKNNIPSDIFDEEWYASLDEPINFITYRRRCEVTIQFRIYRGFEETYTVVLTNKNGLVVWKGELKQIDEIDISYLYKGIYTLTATDSGGNSMDKEVIIG